MSSEELDKSKLPLAERRAARAAARRREELERNRRIARKAKQRSGRKGTR
jgi:hypothetical protein